MAGPAERNGNWKIIYAWHRRWSLDGTWEQALDALRAGCDEAEGANCHARLLPLQTRETIC